MKIKRKYQKVMLHPIMTFCLLILVTIVLSGILSLFNASATYNRVSNTGTYVKELVHVENLFSLRGLKYIFSNAVSSFASFTPLSMLIITLIGFGVMDKSGFLDSFFYVLTKRVSKKVVTFTLSLICILASIGGDLSYIVLIPLAALLFKYGKRHPKAGIICAFASLSCGIGINIFMNSIDSALLGYTELAARLLSPDYSIGTFSYVLVMFVAALILAGIVTSVTEKVVVPKLGKYALLDEEEDYFTKTERKALTISLIAGLIYLLIFIYNIIPNAPLGGNLLDYSQELYIDKLFGYNSFFNHGFVFVVTLLFVILGLVYGAYNKTIKNVKDLCNGFSYSLDYIGKVLVLIFFASALIFIFKKSNFGTVVTAYLASLINNANFTGVPLILLTLFVSAICTLVVPSSTLKWSILSGSVVPAFMNAGISPEFAQLTFRAGECFTYALTPLMAYFVIYLSFMELYSTSTDRDGVWGNIKYLMPYSAYTCLMWIVIIVLCYLIGLPLGIGSSVAL